MSELSTARGMPTPRPPPGPPRVHQRRRFRRRSERRRRPVWCQPTRTVRRHHHAGRHAKRAKSGQIPHDDFRTRLKSHLESSDLKLDEAPSAHRTPLCVFASLPTYTTLSWRSRKSLCGDDDDDCYGSASMGVMAGRAGSNPVRPKLIEALTSHGHIGVY